MQLFVIDLASACVTNETFSVVHYKSDIKMKHHDHFTLNEINAPLGGFVYIRTYIDKATKWQHCNPP